MAIIAPFKGVTYNLDKIAGMENIVAPPYDIISNNDQDYYYEKNPYNVVRLILGKKKTGDSDWDNRYTRAADYFKKWISDEILIRSKEPSIYLTSLEYKSPDNTTTKTRWAFISLVRIEESDSQIIMPHEKTFSFHRQDRLKLMRACNAQFSPIFGLYKDEDNTIFKRFDPVINSLPQLSFTDRDGSNYRMWEVNNSSILKNVSSEMVSKSIVIADGHHRYETARNYRNILRARYGILHTGRAHDYVMMYLTNIADEGISILPTHRLIKFNTHFDTARFFTSVGKYFDPILFPFSPENQKNIQSIFLDQLKDHGRNKTAIGFYYHQAKNFYILLLKPGARESLGDDLHPSLKKLDVLALSRLILQNTLGIKRDELDNEEIIQYESDATKSLSMISSGECQMVFLLNSTKIDQILEITGNSLLMPRKSTYFYPKIITGLVFNMIDPNEIIHIPDS
ncbi:MAG: DUF1015 domain-containing protein [Deltaproteobacteria bacterium]|nr:DUF1015 domain-containing protein [Deltaproteobacteria bacterium]